MLCFTQDNHNERFWDQYADKDTGVAIGFKFSGFNLETRSFYDFRDVFYDKGYSFDFLNAINYNLRKEIGKILLAEGLVKFSKFYKRAKYNWENETRLCFHYDDGLLGHRQVLEKKMPIETDLATGRNYIELPLNGHVKANPFFDLQINEVVCGKYVPESDYQKIREVLAISFPKAQIWQRR